MEKKTATIGGQVYILPPFNTGQMRNHVDPLLKDAREIQSKAKAMDAAGSQDMDALVDIAMAGRELQQRQAEAALMGLRNAYPKLRMEDLDTLTPNQVTTIFNLLIVVTQEGSNEPGEVSAPVKKRSR